MTLPKNKTKNKHETIDQLITEGTTKALKDKKPFSYIRGLGKELTTIEGVDKEKITNKGIKTYSHVYKQLINCKNIPKNTYQFKKFGLFQGAKVMYNYAMSRLKRK